MEGIFSAQFHVRLIMFLANPTHPQLKNHALRGHLMGFRAIAVTGDYRALYNVVKPHVAEFVSIGTHSQVY